MCSPFVRKEANRYFWLVKGHLIPEQESDETVERYYASYFKRLWNNESQCLDIYERGFEAAYQTREVELLNKEVSTVAILGGHYD
jgi:hypothetical protein|tara:strand:- start:1541 stop:1795 length:255 start_codon:yes stop_codon:yes gene_type:complete